MQKRTKEILSKIGSKFFLHGFKYLPNSISTCRSKPSVELYYQFTFGGYCSELQFGRTERDIRKSLRRNKTIVISVYLSLGDSLTHPMTNDNEVLHYLRLTAKETLQDTLFDKANQYTASVLNTLCKLKKKTMVLSCNEGLRRILHHL